MKPTVLGHYLERLIFLKLAGTTTHTSKVETTLPRQHFIGVLTQPTMHGGEQTSRERPCTRPTRKPHIHLDWSGLRNTSSLTSIQIFSKFCSPISISHFGSVVNSLAPFPTVLVLLMLGHKLVVNKHLSIKNSTSSSTSQSVAQMVGSKMVHLENHGLIKVPEPRTISGLLETNGSQLGRRMDRWRSAVSRYGNNAMVTRTTNRKHKSLGSGLYPVEYLFEWKWRNFGFM